LHFVGLLAVDAVVDVTGHTDPEELDAT
jgi:hypothetical protein